MLSNVIFQRHCMNEQPSEIFDCLKKKKKLEDFDGKCRKVILERQRQRVKGVCVFIGRYPLKCVLNKYILH